MNLTTPILFLLAASHAVPCLSASLSECEKGEALAVDRAYGPARDILNSCLAEASLTKSQRARFLKARAWSHLHLAEPSLALADQELAFDTEPPKTKLDFINYAYILRSNKAFDRALFVLRLLQERDAEAKVVDMQTQYHLGWTLREAGKSEKAIAELLRAIPSQPEFPYVHWQLALSYEALYDKKGAEEQLREFRRKCVGEWRPTNQVDEIAVFRSKLAEYGLSEGLEW